MKIDEKPAPSFGASALDGGCPTAVQQRAVGHLALWPVLAASLLAGCGGDGGGNEDTLLTGFSGLLILGAVIWFVLRKVKSRD